MLYVVGGCSRSGKSILAERMRVRHGVPWFPLDAIKMGLHLGAPLVGVHPDNDDLETADRMWPIIKGVLGHLDFDGRDYLVEGVNLRPNKLAAFVAQLDAPTRVCFLGYPDVSVEIKAEQLSRYIGPPQDWLHRTGAENVRRYIEVSRLLSRELRAECTCANFPFVDTGTDFEAGLQEAESILTRS